ncbi:MAG TPA: hypothetical protein VN278_07105 [Methanosarcina sp.]|nr:hypothetical protein [Methanosarcina sp.]
MAKTRKAIITVGILLTAFFAAGCLEQDNGTDLKTGYLEANVTIGPLCPVEPCTISDSQKTEIYSARKIQIYTKNREKLVKELGPDPDGQIKTALEEGKYIVDMKPLGIDRTADLPAEVTILSGKTVYLKISIDTGIR